MYVYLKDQALKVAINVISNILLGLSDKTWTCGLYHPKLIVLREMKIALDDWRSTIVHPVPPKKNKTNQTVRFFHYIAKIWLELVAMPPAHAVCYDL